MRILRDSAPTNWRVLWSQLWIRIHYGMTMALLATSWYVMADYQNPACLYHVFLSHLPIAFLVPTFMSCYHQTSSTKLLREHSKITWWPGLQLISILSTLLLRPNGFLLTLTGGRSSQSWFYFEMMTHPTLLALPQHPHSLAFVASLKAVDSSSGREMTQKRLWRYLTLCQLFWLSSWPIIPGLPSCHCRPCSFTNGACCKLFYGVLLSRPA